MRVFGKVIARQSQPQGHLCRAMGGMPSNSVTSGRDTMAAVRERPATRPSALPASSAMPRPARLRLAEITSSGMARPSRNITPNCCKVATGPGSTSGPYRRPPDSHSAQNSNRLAMAPQPLQRYASAAASDLPSFRMLRGLRR